MKKKIKNLNILDNLETQEKVEWTKFKILFHLADLAYGKKLLFILKKDLFLGYGSMSDRHIINEKRLKNQSLVNPVSNAFLYSLISGGLVTLFLFIFFWISILKKI